MSKTSENTYTTAIDRLLQNPQYFDQLSEIIREIIKGLCERPATYAHYFYAPDQLFFNGKPYDVKQFSRNILVEIACDAILKDEALQQERKEILCYHIYRAEAKKKLVKFTKNEVIADGKTGPLRAPSELITTNNKGTAKTLKAVIALFGIIPEQLSLALTEKIAPTSDQHETKTTEVAKPSESLPIKKSQPKHLTLSLSVFAAILAILLFWFKDDLLKTENPKTGRSEIQSITLLGKSRPASGSATDSVAIKIIGTTTNQYFTFGNNQAPVEEVLLRFIIANHSSQHLFPDEIMAFATAIEGQPNGQLTTASQHQSDDCPIISLTASKPYFSAIIINNDDRLPSIAPHTEITGLVKITMQGEGQQLYQCEASMRLHNQSNQNHTLTLYKDLIYMQ